MKRFFTASISFLFAIASIAQSKFAVPELTDTQKYRIAAIQWNGSYLIQISYAKSLGKPPEDVAKFTADQLKPTLNKQAGYDGFVQGIIYTMVSMVPYGSVEITEETPDALTIKVTGLYTDLREGGSIFDVTYEEYIKFWEIVNSGLADYMGAKYSQKDSDEGLIVTITRKSDK